MNGVGNGAGVITSAASGVNAVFDTWAKKAGLAAIAIGAVYAAYDQFEKLSAVSGGSGGVWEGVKGAVGLGANPNEWGLEGYAKGVDDFQNKQARAEAASRGWKDSPVNKYDGPLSYDNPAKKDWFGVGAQPAASPQASPQPQVATPWSDFNPQDMRDLFKSTIDVNIKDPGKVVDSVDVKNPGKTLAPSNPRSGSNN
jgi:hypothetical protein